MKILILTDGIYPFVIGGMQKHSYYLTKMLVEQGQQVTLVHCVPYGKKLPTHDEVVESMELKNKNGLDSIAIHFPKAGVIPGHYLKESYLYSKRIYDKLKHRLNEFDFIYAKGFSAWHLLHEKQQNKSIPPIGVKFHGYEMFQPPPSFKARLQNLLLRGPVKWNNLHADYVFSYGSKITTIIEQLGVQKKKIIEIPTGIESSWISQSIGENEKLNFVFVGRYERRKGIDELNFALRQLPASTAFHFHFISPIPHSKRLSDERITYHGSITDTVQMKSILDNCQIMVVPSHSEGMPNVIMEGMARGLAVLTTPVGAIEEVVDDTNGWLITPGDKNALKNKLQEILSLQLFIIKQKQEQSRMKISGFLWENIAKLTMEELQIIKFAER